MNLDDDDTVDELPAPPRKEIPPADRELLELAGRALGAVRVEFVDGEEWVNLHFPDGAVIYSWNSLLFSGDTFALGAALRLDVCFRQDEVIVTDQYGEYARANYDEDVESAARRAVTRAAAEIGKSMGQQQTE